MASVYFLRPDVDDFLERAQKFSNESGGDIRLQFSSARVIQSYVRRFLIRCYISHLNKSALIIQKWYRGWRGRVCYRLLLKNTVEEMYLAYYNKMASIIQKTWIGYLSRRDIFSYYALKAWISKVQNTNEGVLAQIKANEDDLKEQRLKEFEAEAQKWVVFILAKLHHLLRTKTVAGIYSKRYSTELSEFERLLKSIQYKKYMTSLRKYYNKIVNAKKPPEKSGEYIPVIGHADLYWYLNEEDLENMRRLGKELGSHNFPKHFANHPKTFTTNTKPSCKERKKEWRVESVFAGKYEEPVRSIGNRRVLDVSKTKFNNYVSHRVVTHSTLSYIDYHINVLLTKRCSVEEDF